MSSSSIPPSNTSASINFVGLPGEPGDLHAINRFKGADPRNEAPLMGSPGDYQVTFVLCRPGYRLLPEAKVSFAGGLAGDSHLAITKPAFTPPDNPDADQVKIYGRTEDGVFTFTGLPNPKGFLGKLISDPFRAADRQDAKRKAYRALASSLSNWSIHLDIPLEIYQIDTTELTTGNSQMSHTNPYWETPFAITPAAELRADFRGYAGIYREALGSSSTVYRFLCFYKIIEGLRARRKRIEREAKKTGATVATAKEILPATANEVELWLNAIFPIKSNPNGRWDPMAIDSAVPSNVRGQEMSLVIDTVLDPLRDNIAHALVSKTGELTMSADELLHTQQVNQFLGLTKCIARRMLKNDFPADFLSYLREDGTIVA